uniref:FA_desaturase domain-containing protein n=1 Tax=Panagrolaimus sp. JU765 TaxID=591449 RepID=A0AC34QUD1_9BILA
MVIRDVDFDPFYIKISGKWVYIDEKMLKSHPGGMAITTYKGKDATTAFHTFHPGSKKAYKTLQKLLAEQKPVIPPPEKPEVTFQDTEINMGVYDKTEEEAKQITENFNKLRYKVQKLELLKGDTSFFVSKFFQCVGLLLAGFFLQYHGYYIPSALFMGLAWQQLGWMIHEYCHHQHFENHYWNDLMSYVVGNLLQGFSSGGWKEQHNVHHAATNVVGRDGDLDLIPFWATVVTDLTIIYKNSPAVFQIVPYQHIYWTFALPFLRLSWLLQSINFVIRMETSPFDIHRKRARYEQITLMLHWLWVVLQLYFLPDWNTRVTYFLVSQLFGGFLLAHVVTYNHYSTDKFSNQSNIMNNYACLQLYTTRNMRPGVFIDWLWGGLNYQIEHHLFPTMPRNNLCKVMPLVKQFCAENNLPYMVDDYFTGWKLEIEQFARVARVAEKMKTKFQL